MAVELVKDVGIDASVGFDAIHRGRRRGHEFGQEFIERPIAQITNDRRQAPKP